MYNKKKIILSILVLLLLLAIGVTYAFFTYESGTKSDIVTGQIYMNYEETSIISLLGVFPETKAQALSRQDENGVFEFTITGRNTSQYPVYYEIDLLEGGLITGATEQSTKILPEHVRIYLERDGEVLIDGKTYNDWDNRRVLVETVPAGTTSNIEHNYVLKMWIDENVTISNTNPDADYTTTEWNNSYTSLKVRVVGDFNPKELPGTMARLETENWYFWEQSIIDVRANIKEINFIRLDNSEIDTRYNSATIKSDVSTSDEYPVKAWLEVNETDSTKYTMYVASEEEIYFPSDISDMFEGFISAEKINFENVDTSQVANMEDLFSYCRSLVFLDLSMFDTSNVVNMNFVFMECNALVEIIGIENFDTNKVTSMEAMFFNSEMIRKLDLIEWNTSRLVNASNLFAGCSGLEYLDVSGWDTSCLTNIAYAFYNCKSLISLDLSTWDMSNVENTRVMFQYVSKATEIKLPNDVKVIGAYMFNHNYAHVGDTFTIPASVEKMGYSHMWYGFGTTFNEFVVADGNKNFKAVDGVLYTSDGTRLIAVPTHKTNDTKTLEIPEGVTFINENSFSTNKKLETLILPDSYVITRYVGKSSSLYDGDNVNTGSSLSIGVYLRTNISTYVVKDTNPNYTSVDGCLYSKDGSELIAVPWQYNGALSIKEGTTTIGQEAFWTYGANSTSETTKLTSVHIPASVTTIQSAQLTALNKLVGRITITIDEANPNYTVSGGKIVTK